jgi:hypothetical protein
VIIVLGIGALFALLRLRGPLEAATATISRAFADTVRLAGPVAPTSR